MTRRDAATERQVQAADPSSSVWLSANAGSGKTRVLTDRVARLLLQGVSPQHILCLTYTKAAASEMQNRLFKRLGEWAMQDEAALTDNLSKLGLDGSVDRDVIARARRLFARAIETPGGLKIQTIHSFCASLLRRFPLEAGVTPQFKEMDDRAAKLLREEIVETIADGPDGRVIDALAAYLSGDDLGPLTAEIVKHKDRFVGPVDADAIWTALGLAPGLTEDDIVSNVVLGGEADLFAALLPILRAGTTTDVKAANALAGIDPRVIRASDLAVMEGVFLFGATAKAGPFSAKIDAFPTKNTREALGDTLIALNDLMARVETARAQRISLYSAQKTRALIEFAQVFVPEYEARKATRGWLDFDDLILKARALLTDPAVAQWVLFRLDGGIDHILVDEAQDTSPVQWAVVERLAQEFTAGQGARSDVERSIFVVGDKKQSIYSFQGADPEGFDRMRAHFEGRLGDAGKPFRAMQLEHSFRSAEAILRLVDLTFQDRVGNGLGGQTHHIAFKSGMPGRVDLWPVVPKADDPEPGDWHDPIDRISENHHSVVLANRIADQIAGMIGSATIPEEIENSGSYRMRHVRAGDILILVQRRSALFHELIRACKSRELAIAGADRLRIGAELAVKDITALLSFLATAEDDLSLAAALRSPLFGWTQQQLHALAQPRGNAYLWRALQDRKDEHPEAVAMLTDLRDNADFLRPYDLIERILTRHNGRRNLLARLGAEAEDGIDALLAQALSYEQNDVPSLTGFLVWLASDEVTIKRQLDSAGDRIRVMTVHGAKGLESPIVILPDTGKPDRRIRDEILCTDDGAFWKTPAESRPGPLQTAHDDLAAKRQAEQDRLLYVAMTRAEKWLIVAGCGDMGKEGDAWHDMVARGVETAGATAQGFGFGDGLRLETGDWSAPAEAVEASATVAVDVPDWATAKAAAPVESAKTLAPSGLGGTKALPGDSGLDEAAALLRGTRIHRLLEHLPAYPPADWPDIAGALLANDETPVDAAESGLLLDEASRVLNAPELRFLFAPDTLAEVDISAALPELDNARIHGAIDRLIVTDAKVLAVDFKTNAIVPACAEETPDGILRQLGAYHAALMQLYPDRQVETAVLWTSTATFMPVPQYIVMDAISRATAS